MGLLDRFEGMIIDKAAAAVLDMVENHPGEAHEIAARLQECGLGHLVQSWVGPGVNLNVTPDQIRGVLAEEGTWLGSPPGSGFPSRMPRRRSRSRCRW